MTSRVSTQKRRERTRFRPIRQRRSRRPPRPPQAGAGRSVREYARCPRRPWCKRRSCLAATTHFPRARQPQRRSRLDDPPTTTVSTVDATWTVKRGIDAVHSVSPLRPSRQWSRPTTVAVVVACPARSPVGSQVMAREDSQCGSLLEAPDPAARHRLRFRPATTHTNQPSRPLSRNEEEPQRPKDAGAQPDRYCCQRGAGAPGGGGPQLTIGCGS